jgi:Rrf2 family protein
MIIDIAQHCESGAVRIQDVAERQGVSAKYLEKLIRKLKDVGFIKSKRGPRGGHSLARPASEILIGEVVHALEGDNSLVECRTGKEDCDRIEVCLTRKLWTEAADAMYAHLNSITLADLLDDAKKCSNPKAIPMLMD